MSKAITDRNLLFGILALQLDFISRDALIAAMNAWVLDKAKPLGEVLCAQHALTPDNRAWLEAGVERHLAQHGNDAEKSLASVSSVGSLRDDLKRIADPDVQASIVSLPSPPGLRASEPPGLSRRIRGEPANDPYATTGSVGQATSKGERFRIVRPHAEGGLGKVFIAQDEELHREVALKEIKDRHADNPESRTRFLLEAEITGGLEHPGIVPVYGLGQYADGRPFYAMRFIRGDSLKDAIERYHSPPEPEALAKATDRNLELRKLLGRFIDVCQAMQYAHDRGVLHRDLKPGNIMLGKYGETLVVDWGLAKATGEPATTGTAEPVLMPTSISGSTPSIAGAAVGTPAFMSPEQAAGQLQLLGPASDVYSLGATLYCLLTGKPPVDGADLGVVLAKIQRGEFARPRQVNADVDPALEAICVKAMALRPPDRYASPQKLADDVEHWLADEPIDAWQEPWTVTARRWMARHRTLVAGTAAAALVGLVSLIVATFLLSAANDRLADERNKVQQANTSLDAMNKDLTDYMFRSLLTAEPKELAAIQTALALHKDAVKDRLWDVLESPKAGAGQRLRAACALAEYDANNSRWQAVSRDVVLLAVQEVPRTVPPPAVPDRPLALGAGRESLRQIKQWLINPLQAVLKEKGVLGDAARTVALELLLDYAADRPGALVEAGGYDLLAEMDQNADDAGHARLLPLLKAKREEVIPLMRQALVKPAPPDEVERDRLAKRQARTAVALLQLGDADPVWPLLRHTEDPSLRTYLTHDLGRRGTDVEIILSRLETETDTSARRALVLSLGEFAQAQISPAQQQRILPRLLKWYHDDPDAGVHGAVEWLLRHGEKGAKDHNKERNLDDRKLDWKHRQQIEEIDMKLAALSPAPGNLPAGSRQWYVSPKELMTMTVIREPAPFQVGTPIVDPKDINKNEYPHRVKIPRSFAIATKEVTVAQFNRFLEDNPKVKAKHFYQIPKSPVPDGPILEVNWFQAAQFCNWLSKREGIPKEQWCYPDIDEFDYNMVLPKDYLHRLGYRLPTEAEWEYAARAGALTSRFYGTSEEMLKEYAWFSKTSNTRTFPVGQLKPNDLGIFDIYGNAMEWCQNQGDYYPVPKSKEDVWVDQEDKDGELKLTKAQPRVLRGGSFFYLARSVRSAFRDYYRPSAGIMYVGLRPARTMP